MSYKNSAVKVLEMQKKPLHSRKITQIAVKKGWLQSDGQTPDLTMNAQLIRDINTKKEKSRFIKRGPSVFSLNSKFKERKKILKPKRRNKTIQENYVKNSITSWLSKKGWIIEDLKTLREKGVDIELAKPRKKFFIEAKGYGSKRKNDEHNFIKGLGQIITRIEKTGISYYYGLGFPTTTAKLATKRLSWKVAKKLNLHVFSVDSNKNVVQYSWRELKKKQDFN